jgi:hypothetical protein
VTDTSSGAARDVSVETAETYRETVCGPSAQQHNSCDSDNGRIFWAPQRRDACVDALQRS